MLKMFAAPIGLPALSLSEKHILGLVFKAKRLTQAEISDATKLTQQSVSRLTSKLIDRGMLTEGEKVTTGKRGYPSATVKLKHDYTYSFGVSIMADAVTLSLVNFQGKIMAERTEGLPSMRTAPVIAWLKSSISELSSDHIRKHTFVTGLGVGIAGSHIGDGCGYNTPYSLDDWANKDIGQILTAELNTKIWSDNDGNVAALGENMIGAGRWANSFGYLYISTGVGGGLILDGHLWRGRHGNAGEFAGGLPPNIFPFPNLELLRQICVSNGHDFPTVHKMIQNFDPSWEAVDDWIGRVRDSLSIIASNMTAILDLDAIVLGGRIPKSLTEKVIPHIEFFDQKRRDVARPIAKLVPAEAEGDTAALGAALLPLRHSYFK